MRRLCVNTPTATGERQGLNPNYNIDYIGFPSNYYNTVASAYTGVFGTANLPEEIDGNRNYFKNSSIKDNNFRPISYMSSSLGYDDPDDAGDEAARGERDEEDVEEGDPSLEGKLADQKDEIEDTHEFEIYMASLEDQQTAQMISSRT